MIQQQQLKEEEEEEGDGTEKEDLWIEAMHWAATCRYLNGEYTSASALYSKVLSLEPNHIGVLGGKALVQDSLIPMHGDVKEAYQSFQKALITNPWTHMLWPRYSKLKSMSQASSFTQKESTTTKSLNSKYQGMEDGKKGNLSTKDGTTTNEDSENTPFQK
eukprot:CAMPEP_0114337436 /NCGR_PEP_ID=MMETSP0101-20121206/6358_1 /TAXON_ID=38822 ORGANISM="Pteridomonas danica, Strain PT" /NCGR_SAMPLE_ID=MMETSP0101 /ASSEMBLY_ACC=CAM_ASM_000211 /LENGTH=160 /DNA_ID=CAMNT_0001469663 /DNA_START=1549 /DNA_END=2031 /DNA_ORIENTATION=+